MNAAEKLVPADLVVRVSGKRSDGPPTIDSSEGARQLVHAIPGTLNENAPAGCQRDQHC